MSSNSSHSDLAASVPSCVPNQSLIPTTVRPQEGDGSLHLALLRTTSAEIRAGTAAVMAEVETDLKTADTLEHETRLLRQAIAVFCGGAALAKSLVSA
eukprot:SAG31_NODE_13921_length_837_cov_1.395664_2_plen_97_part_01